MWQCQTHRPTLRLISSGGGEREAVPGGLCRRDADTTAPLPHRILQDRGGVHLTPTRRPLLRTDGDDQFIRAARPHGGTPYLCASQRREHLNIFHQLMDMFCPQPGYEVVFHPVDTTVEAVIYEDRSLTVTTIPLEHRVPCCGFLFREKATYPHINKEMVDFYQIPYSQINNIKAGADWTMDDGTVVANSRLVLPADPVRAYAYCSDTKYLPHLHERLKDVDLLYHESTYGDDKLDNASKYCHSTARQAAMVARDAGVKRLMLGHYSARYTDESVLLRQAQEIFPDTILSDEGLTVDV